MLMGLTRGPPGVAAADGVTAPGVLSTACLLRSSPPGVLVDASRPDDEVVVLLWDGAPGVRWGSTAGVHASASLWF